uniref:Ycf55 n=1 Tax=Compsopogon caeruleus TaxID=31354 RepID=A0A1Z1XAW5_9RHOD|nr:hypothetical protein [Compsopogon caeruleus]ARX95994.1 hypothetical protein [Compsopogon caeruleus]
MSNSELLINKLFDRYNSSSLQKLAVIFVELEVKFSLGLENIENKNQFYHLYILDYHNQSELLLMILKEIIIVFLTILQLNFSISQLIINNFFLKKIIYNIFIKFFNKYLSNKEILNILKKYYSTNLLNKLDVILWQELCLSSLFELSYYESKKKFHLIVSSNLYLDQMSLLFENFILKIANSMSAELYYYINDNNIEYSILNLLNPRYLSLRNFRYLKNNLFLSSLLDNYIYIPKLIYNNKYKALHLSSNKITSYIFNCYRNEEISYLSNLQLIIIIFLELQDLLWPKIRRTLYSFGKLIIYIYTYLFGNTIRIFFQNIKDITQYFFK